MYDNICVKRVALKIGSGKTPEGGAEAYVPEGVSFIRSQNVHFDGLRLDDVVFIDLETDVAMASTRVRSDDVLLNITGASLGRAAIATKALGPANVNQHVCIVRPSKQVAPKFLLWCLQSHLVQTQIFEKQVGANRDGLNFEQVGDLAIPYPPLDAQRAIAGYLDRETTRIDAVIATLRRMVDRLDEREISLIHELTGRGIRNAFFIESGIHWLGRIPAHWQVMQIRRIAQVKRGASPRPIDDPVYFDDDGEYAWVRIADVTDSERYLTRTTQRLSQLGSSLSAKLTPGSLFVSIAGSVGKPIITRIKCCVHDGFVYFDHLRIRPDYLYYLFRASQLFQGLGKLGTQLNLNTETIGGISIPIPPPDEQDEIVAELDLRLAANNKIRSANLRQVELLQERRLALITAAVTGQHDTPEAA